VSDTVTEASVREVESPVVARLSRLDRFLPVWLLAAMALGLGLGRFVPGIAAVLDSAHVTTGVSAPIFVGLLVMMYPVLAKVRYGQLGQVTNDIPMLLASLVLNWLIGPAVMFALAWLLLPDQPAYRTGLIIVGLARCIAMVLIWNDLSGGDRDAAAVLVALNSLFQIVAFAALGWFYLQVLPGWLGLATAGLHVSIATIATSVAIFLGVPLVAGFLTRVIGERTRGRTWYEQRLLPRINPWALIGLLFTIVVLFALQGDTITRHPGDVARIALPLLAYFALMWTGGFALGRGLGLPYPRTATLAFTAAGNNFELAIAVAIGVFGVTSGQALAGVVGPLIEVPVLVALVYVALWARRRFYPSRRITAASRPRPTPGACMSSDTTSGVPEVLFVCVHNAGRSQMAAALLNHHAAGSIRVRSAGFAPADEINPGVVQAMAEIGIDLSQQVPTELANENVAASDVVITMGCGDARPIYPGKRYLDWDIPNPAGLPVEQVRPIRDAIDTKVQTLIDELPQSR